MNWILKLLIQEILSYVTKAVGDAIARHKKMKENKKTYKDIMAEKNAQTKAARARDFFK